MCYTYIIRCKNNSLYTGYTTDIKRRIEEHNIGKNCKYTKIYGISKLEICFKSKTKSEAMKVEYYIKQLNKLKKENIINSPEIFIDEIKNEKLIKIEVFNMK